jgi:hypothetical protein
MEVKAVENRQPNPKERAMKWLIAVAMLAAAALLPAKSASGQEPRAHYMTIQYSVPPVRVKMYCDVNNQNWPVDFANRVWGMNNESGLWYILGQIVFTPNGPVVNSRWGVYPAVC